MRAKRVERNQAIVLRKRGLSYSEIRRQIPVAKSSLSLWLRQIRLLDWQRERLSDKKKAAWQLGSQVRHMERLTRIARINADGRREARLWIRKKEVLWFLGAALYWAEGTRIRPTHRSERLEFTNSDPAMIKIFRNWVKRYCGVTVPDLIFSLYIHERADVGAAQGFWMSSLGIRSTELRTYFKHHNPSPRSHNTGSSYYGTMRVSVRRSVNLSHRIAAWIQEVVARCGVG